MHTPPAATFADPCDLADDDFGRAVTLGTAIGLPVIYVLTVLILLAGGAGVGPAFAVAVLPSIVGGPYAGGLMVLARTMQREERSAPVLALPSKQPADHAERAA